VPAAVKSRTDGKMISPHWVRPKYPRYWHYDMLGGLVAMAEMGLIKDARCADALNLLERKELPERRLGRARAVLQSVGKHGYEHALRIHFPGRLGQRRKRSHE